MKDGKTIGMIALLAVGVYALSKARAAKSIAGPVDAEPELQTLIAGKTVTDPVTGLPMAAEEVAPDPIVEIMEIAHVPVPDLVLHTGGELTERGGMVIKNISGIPFAEVGIDPDPYTAAGVPYATLQYPRRVMAYTLANATWTIRWNTYRPATFYSLEPGLERFTFTLHGPNQTEVHRGASQNLIGDGVVFSGNSAMRPIYDNMREVETPGIYEGGFEWELYIGGDINGIVARQMFRIKNMLEIG